MRAALHACSELGKAVALVHEPHDGCLRNRQETGGLYMLLALTAHETGEAGQVGMFQSSGHGKVQIGGVQLSVDLLVEGVLNHGIQHHEAILVRYVACEIPSTTAEPGQSNWNKALQAATRTRRSHLIIRGRIPAHAPNAGFSRRLHSGRSNFSKPLSTSGREMPRIKASVVLFCS